MQINSEGNDRNRMFMNSRDVDVCKTDKIKLDMEQRGPYQSKASRTRVANNRKRKQSDEVQIKSYGQGYKRSYMEWIGRERKDSENRIISQIDQGWNIDNIKRICREMEWS